MLDRSAYNLLPYDKTPDPRVVNRLAEGVITIRRRHPETGQTLVIVGTNHLEKPGSQEAEVVYDAFQHFRGSTRTQITPKVSCEGRIPPVRHNGILYPGERTPEVNTSDLNDAMRKHTGVGLVSCLAVESGYDLEPFENDRQIILQLEKFFPRDLILKYLCYRQIPQYYRIDKELRPGLADYMTETALRYGRILQPEWEGYDFSIDRIMGREFFKAMNFIGEQIEEREAEYLFESTGHMLGMVKRGQPLSSIQQVSEAYHTLNEILLTDSVTNLWGEIDSPDRYHSGGIPHVIAISGRIANLGEAM